MKFLFILCAFFMTTATAQAALQVIPPQQGEKPVISTLPALPSPSHAAPVLPSYREPSRSTVLPTHGFVTVEKSFSKIPFLGTCVVKGNVKKVPSIHGEQPSFYFKPTGKTSTGAFKDSSGSLKEILAMQIPPGWVGYITEDIVAYPVTGVFESTSHWTETFCNFLETNRLQGYVHMDSKRVYAQKLDTKTNPSVTSALRDAEKRISPPSSVTPLQESAYTALTAPSTQYTYSIRPGLLKGQLEDWCRAANFDLIWLSKNDFQLQGSQAFGNDFQKSVVDLFDLLYKEGRMSLKAQIFLGNKILRVRQD